MQPFTIKPKGDEGRFCVLQLTDTHLFEDEEGELLGINTRCSLAAVLEAIASQQIPYDLVLVTGDISQDYSAQSYYLFARMTAELKAPIFFLPGNHDDGPLEYRLFEKLGINTSRHMICGNWQFVMLNSEVYSQAHGWVQREELEFLQWAVTTYPKLHTAVGIHHLPLNVDSQWLDTQTLHNQDEFRAFVNRMSTVRLVLCGHVHQEFDETRRNVRYIASPSTSIQFMPHSQEFELDTRAPGWRYIYFNTDGSVDTEVYRLEEGLFVPNYSARGY